MPRVLDAAGMPYTVIAQQPANASVTKALYQLIHTSRGAAGEEGVWNQLLHARNKLVELLSPYIPRPDENDRDAPRCDGATSFRSDLNRAELYDFLLEHSGLRGEFANGPENNIGMFLRPRANGVPREITTTHVKNVLRVFAAPSSLSQRPVNAKTHCYHVSPSAAAESYGQGKPIPENKLDAIERIGREITDWVNQNDAIPHDKKKTIGAVLEAYRAAAEQLPELLRNLQECLTSPRVEQQEYPLGTGHTVYR